MILLLIFLDFFDFWSGREEERREFFLLHFSLTLVIFVFYFCVFLVLFFVG